MDYSRLVEDRKAIKAGRLAVCLVDEGRGGVAVFRVGSDQISSCLEGVSFFSSEASVFAGIGGAFTGSSWRPRFSGGSSSS